MGMSRWRSIKDNDSITAQRNPVVYLPPPDMRLPSRTYSQQCRRLVLVTVLVSVHHNLLQTLRKAVGMAGGGAVDCTVAHAIHHLL
jgi:hypothetical protein